MPASLIHVGEKPLTLSSFKPWVFLIDYVHPTTTAYHLAVADS